MKRKITIPVMWISLWNNTLACACSSIQWNGYLLLPVAGFRNSNPGTGSSRGSDGNYWSGETDDTKSSHLGFSSSGAGVGPNYRTYGFSVRCVQEFTKVNL